MRDRRSGARAPCCGTASMAAQKGQRSDGPGGRPRPQAGQFIGRPLRDAPTPTAAGAAARTDRGGPRDAPARAPPERPPGHLARVAAARRTRPVRPRRAPRRRASAAAVMAAGRGARVSRPMQAVPARGDAGGQRREDDARRSARNTRRDQCGRALAAGAAAAGARRRGRPGRPRGRSARSSRSASASARAPRRPLGESRVELRAGLVPRTRGRSRAPPRRGRPRSGARPRRRPRAPARARGAPPRAPGRAAARARTRARPASPRPAVRCVSPSSSSRRTGSFAAFNSEDLRDGGSGRASVPLRLGGIMGSDPCAFKDFRAFLGPAAPLVVLRVPMPRLIESVPNISEGRRPRRGGGGGRGAPRDARACACSTSSRTQDHNRSVLTAGRRRGRALRRDAGALRGRGRADRPARAPGRAPAHGRRGRGAVHPDRGRDHGRLRGARARASARRWPSASGCPSSSTRRRPRAPHRQNLEDVRRGQFEGLAKKMTDAQWAPDFGPAAPHASAGASVGGRAHAAHRLQHQPGDVRPGDRASASPRPSATRTAASAS